MQSDAARQDCEAGGTTPVSFMYYVRGLVRLTLFLVVTAATVIWMKAAALLHAPDRWQVARIGQRWARTLMAVLGVEVQIRGQMPAGRQLVLANHRSYIDIAAIQAVIPCNFLSKKEIGEWPLMGTAARLNNTVFVDRECRKSRKQARVKAKEVLDHGMNFAAFPEGTTTAGPGIERFYKGLFEVAHENGYPIVPIALEYGERDDAWIDKDGFLEHFIRCFGKPRVYVSVAIGPQVQPGDPTQTRLFVEGWIKRNLTVPVPARPSTEQIPDLAMT